MQLLISPDGSGRCVYAEAIDRTQIGHVSITRGSHVEPDDDGRWFAILAPVEGPQLGPFPRRSDALKAEAEWLDGHWLVPPQS